MDTRKAEPPETGRQDSDAPADRRPAWTLGGVLVIVYLWEVIVFKSRLGRIPAAWVVHMGLSGLLPAIIIWHAFWEGKRLDLPEDIERRRASVYVICVLIAVWGTLSALAQDTYLAELGFVGMWALMVAASWIAAPRLLASVPTGDLIRWAALPLKLGVVASAVWLLVGPSYDPATGRFAGVFYTSPAGGEVFMLCGIVVLAQILTSAPRPRAIDLGILALALSCALLTRSRGVIAVTAAAISAMWFSRPRGTTRLERALPLATLALGLVLAAEVGADDREVQQAATFLRVEKGIRASLLVRSGTHEQGLRDMMASPLFGKGFTSRYSTGGGLHLEDRLRGDAHSMLRAYTYDDDPHLMVITLGKAIGVPGLFLGLALLLAIARVGWHAAPREESARVLLVGLVVFILGHSLFTNTLTSFGAIADRYAWVLVGLLVARTLPAEHPVLPQHKSGAHADLTARTSP